MFEKKRTAWASVLIALLLLILDQVSKLLAVRFLAGSGGVTVIPGVFDLYYLENTGAAFGMMKNGKVLFIVIAAVILVITCFLLFRLPDGLHYHPLRAGCLLIAAGTAGNLSDRIFNGYVIDFLSFSLIDFPVFNLADSFICVGAVMTVVLILTLYRRDDFSFLNPGSKG